MKRTIEIDDTLQDRIDSLIADTRDLLQDWLDANKPDSPPDLSDLDYDGAIHELVDSATPIYYSEIDGLWYLYRDQFEQAYNDAGIGDTREPNYQQVAIYCYLEQAVADWYGDNVEHVFDRWMETQPTTAHDD
jgi:hypothetical protein